MNLERLVRTGEAPWRPSPDVTGLDVWLGWDHPCAGTFRVGPDLVLFTVAYEDDGDKVSVWAYVPVPAQIEGSFSNQQFDTAADLRRFVNDFFAFAGSPAVFAAASDMSIARWGIQPVPAEEDGLTSAAADFVESLNSAFPVTPATRLQAAVKLAEATELVSS